jgi:glucosyl-dolichyl phosphate glucuronosyltransferase
MTSIIIVTYNRKHSLAKCLESILSQKAAGGLEAIVVDNCSRDGTVSFITGLFNGRIRLIRNAARQSLWEAKNTGFRASRGERIVFIDDDCIASERWLEEINRTLSGFDCAGGATCGAPGTSFPWWWDRSLEWLVGINTAPDTKFPPLGSALAFRRNVLETMLAATLDFTPKEYLPYGEDNFRIRQALELHFTLGINREMAVYHMLPPEKFTASHFFSRSVMQGKAAATYQHRARDLLASVLLLPYNVTRSLCFLDINRFFRAVENACHIVFLTRNRLAAAVK